MNNRKLLPIGMIFQFLFTVIGGGLFISGLIAGFSLKWDMSGEDNKARIALLLAIFGGILFLIGILITVFLYKLSVLPSSEKDAGEDADSSETGGEEVSEESSISDSGIKMPDGAEIIEPAPDMVTDRSEDQ